MKRPLITLLTDFGAGDHYVAAMKGVILGICPQAEIIDISHEIPAFQIGFGAYTLAQAAPAFPAGTIHVAVVDPGVGTARRAIAARAGGQVFLGPDNGLLSMALGLTPRVAEITNRKLFRQPVSTTFHGRDIFAPVAAHLASGLAWGKIGQRITDWRLGDFLAVPQTGPSEWTGSILSMDHFGNIVTNFPWKEFGDVFGQSFELKLGRTRIRTLAATYGNAPAETPFVLCGSSGFAEIALRHGSAVRKTGALPATPLLLRRL